ncbi:peroxiredoxin-like family protein [Pontiella sp.]|uniref:peroxiredoxin-like family protein n=1 Tax=Pontiella sp. TaxID=2837462 RepID=UPI003566E24D
MKILKTAGALFAVSTLLVSCAKQSGVQDMTSEHPETSLKAQLDSRKEAFGAKAPADVKKIYAEGLQAVVDSGIVQQAKQLGDTAPDFELTNAAGKKVKLSDALKDGPVVLTWYRGGWCPYCNLTLHALQAELPNFKAAGATLFALTPEVPDQSMSTAEKHALEFEVLSDLDSHVAREYGIVFKLTDEVAAIYEEKFGLSDYNGNDAGELPLAATYVINTDGTIAYAFLDADYRNRAEPAEITRVLNSL